MAKTTVLRIVIEDLNMRKKCSKLVPKVLTDEQKDMRVFRCREMLEMYENDPIFLKLIYHW